MIIIFPNNNNFKKINKVKLEKKYNFVLNSKVYHEFFEKRQSHT